MSLPRLVRWLLLCSWVAFFACIIAQVSAALGFNPAKRLYIALFLCAFLVAGATGIVQFKVVVIERDWLLGSYQTLLRRFPMWIVLLCVALVVGIVAQALLQPADYSYLSVALGFALEAGALSSLSRQPWLLIKHSCQNGHEVNFYNRFCPTCGVLLPSSPGRT